MKAPTQNQASDMAYVRDALVKIRKDLYHLVDEYRPANRIAKHIDKAMAIAQAEVDRYCDAMERAEAEEYAQRS